MIKSAPKISIIYIYIIVQDLPIFWSHEKVWHDRMIVLCLEVLDFKWSIVSVPYLALSSVLSLGWLKCRCWNWIWEPLGWMWMQMWLVPVESRYEIVQKLGRGAYGIVWKAIDKKTREAGGWWPRDVGIWWISRGLRQHRQRRSLRWRSALTLFRTPLMPREPSEKSCSYRSGFTGFTGWLFATLDVAAVASGNFSNLPRTICQESRWLLLRFDFHGHCPWQTAND